MQLRKVWKEAANVIIAAPSAQPSTDSHCDYDVLTVNGTTLSKLDLKSYVLPGGTLDTGDFSYKWWLLFERSGTSPEMLCKRLTCAAKHRPPIISDSITLEELRRWSCDEEDLLCTDIALRLAAIRHLFAQTGNCKIRHGQWGEVGQPKTPVIKKNGKTPLSPQPEPPSAPRSSAASFWGFFEEISLIKKLVMPV